MSDMTKYCKTCRHLKRIEAGENILFRCGYTITIPAPWPLKSFTFQPNYHISPRHVVEGDHYMPDADGSTLDWTEVMDCPVHE